MRAFEMLLFMVEIVVKFTEIIRQDPVVVFVCKHLATVAL